MIQDETEKLKKYKIILLDGDGVLWKMDQPIFGINPFFNFLSEHGIHWAPDEHCSRKIPVKTGENQMSSV